MFGISQETIIVNLYYNLTATYQKPNGRFNLIFSNSAIIDCHYIFGAFIDSLKVALLPYKDEYPKAYNEAMELLSEI